MISFTPGGKPYRDLMIRAATWLDSPVTITPGNISQLTFPDEVYNRITMEILGWERAGQHVVGSSSWIAEMNRLAGGGNTVVANGSGLPITITNGQTVRLDWVANGALEYVEFLSGVVTARAVALDNLGTAAIAHDSIESYEVVGPNLSLTAGEGYHLTSAILSLL